jgi:serine/threonine-protein kinase
MVGDAPGAAEPGARVAGKYQLIRRLATGGMGDVWIARNDATGAEVAAKWCKVGERGEQAVERLRQEARVGAMLVHRHIVRVFDLVEDPDRGLLLVMELLRGETLESYLRVHGPLGADRAVEIAIPVLSALAHAHAVGIVHRDVTPANIVLDVDPDGHVTPKLLDFGIAKVPDSAVQTADGRVLGSPRYMAPERIRGREIDARSDLFSVGVVLYEMMTGASPFAATSPSASLAAVLENVVDPDPRIPPRIWIEIRRALSKQPYERHRDARAMAEALQAAHGGGSPIDAAPLEGPTGVPPAGGSGTALAGSLSTDDFPLAILPIVDAGAEPRERTSGDRPSGATTKAIVVGAAALLAVLVLGVGVTMMWSRGGRTSDSDRAKAAGTIEASPNASASAGTGVGGIEAPGRGEIAAPTTSVPPAAPPAATAPGAVTPPPIAAPHHSAKPVHKTPKPIATSPGF